MYLITTYGHAGNLQGGSEDNKKAKLNAFKSRFLKSLTRISGIERFFHSKLNVNAQTFIFGKVNTSELAKLLKFIELAVK